MDGDVIRTIERVTERLHNLAEEFPDFRYVELSGAAISSERLTDAVLTAFIGDSDCPYPHDGDERISRCGYGSTLDESVAALSAVADEVWLAIRHVTWHSRQSDTAATDSEFPAFRATGVPFILIGTTLEMAIEFPQRLAEEVAKLGVNFPQHSGGGTQVHVGEVT